MTLEHAHGKLGYDGEVGAQILSDVLTELFIVLERLDLLDPAKRLECIVVQVIDFVDMRVRGHDVGQLLHVPYPMRDPGHTDGG